MMKVAEKESEEVQNYLFCRINLVCFLAEKTKLSIYRTSEIFNKKLQTTVFLI